MAARFHEYPSDGPLSHAHVPCNLPVAEPIANGSAGGIPGLGCIPALLAGWGLGHLFAWLAQQPDSATRRALQNRFFGGGQLRCRVLEAPLQPPLWRPLSSRALSR